MAPSIRRDLYSEVTSSILAELEAGAAQECRTSPSKESDKRAFFTAASKAQAAADYLRGLALAEPIAEAA